VRQKRFSVEQIVAVLKQAEAGVPLAELLRRVGKNNT
jgi:putative transposase